MSRKKTLLLEIGCEEIPARFMPSALEMLQGEACKMVSAARLFYHEIVTLGTPRRLILLIHGLEEKQGDQEEKKKGPAARVAFDPDGRPTRAAEGFARSQGVSVHELIRELVEDTEYVFARKRREGRLTTEVLPELLPVLIQRITFPRPMFWESREVRFARPIRWLCSLYGEEPLDISHGGVESAPQTYGHRFLSPGPHPVKSAAEYLEILRNNYVMADPREREEKILRETAELAAALGGEALIDQDLLSEVNFLVEYPMAVAGSYAEEYLKLPREVLVTTMQSHQRYFPVQERGGGRLLPFFITIANGVEKIRANVRTGNERVLRARLADAAFFFREDLKIPLEERVEELKNIVFQEELGTLWQKTLRIRDMTDILCSSLNLPPGEREEALRAAYLCKGDLATGMVYEFSELQGIMGREYALKGGEPPGVAEAIHRHYQPRFAGDGVPGSAAGAAVALADKIDNMVAAFSLGKEPTGSQDPYALRRQALGIITILESRKLSLDLKALLTEAYLRLEQDAKGSLKSMDETVNRVHHFIMQRLKFVLLEEGLRYDVVDALIHAETGDPFLVSARARQLAGCVEDEGVRDLLAAYTRVVNLAAKAPEGAAVREELFFEEEEKKLFNALERLQTRGKELLAAGDFPGFLAEGARIRPLVDSFFDRIMVMVDEEDIRHNRLALLKEIRDVFLDVVDLGKIVSQ